MFPTKRVESILKVVAKGAFVLSYCYFCGSHRDDPHGPSCPSALAEKELEAINYRRHAILMEKMVVKVNRWLGDGFQFPRCLCWSCGKPSTVAEIMDIEGAILARLCGTCLDRARAAVDFAILEAASSPSPPWE